MGLLFPTESETNLYSDMMLEAAYLSGTRIKIKFVEKATLDMYQDPNYEYEMPKELELILEEHPKERFLRDMKWYNEDDETMPLVAYFAKRDYDDFNVKMLLGVLIELPYVIDEKTMSKTYKVMDARAFGPGPFFWICKLVPVRGQFEIDKDEDTQDPNYSYLDIPVSARKQGDENYEYLAVNSDGSGKHSQPLEGVYYFDPEGEPVSEE